MCSTHYHELTSGDQFRDRLNVRAFSVRFTGLNAYAPLPDSLTLLYLDGSKIRPETRSQFFIALHRVVSARTKDGVAIFCSRERVRAMDGLGFEVYVEGQRALKGIFRKLEGQDWKLECKCEIVGAEAADICVAAEGRTTLTEMIVLSAVKVKRMGFVALETIPEETQDECGSDGGGLEELCDDDVEMAMGGVSWALDVGLWFVYLGVGFMVSKSSAKTLRRLKIL